MNDQLEKGMKNASCDTMLLHLLRYSGLLCTAVSLLLNGCTNSAPTRTLQDKSSKKLDSPTQPSSILWPAGMHRLAMLPIYANRPIDATQRYMDGIFRAQLSRVVKYEIVEVSREEMLTLTNREAVD